MMIFQITKMSHVISHPLSAKPIDIFEIINIMWCWVRCFHALASGEINIVYPWTYNVILEFMFQKQGLLIAVYDSQDLGAISV